MALIVTKSGWATPSSSMLVIAPYEGQIKSFISYPDISSINQVIHMISHMIYTHLKPWKNGDTEITWYHGSKIEIYLADIDAGRFKSASVFVSQVRYCSNGVQTSIFGQSWRNHFQGFSIGTGESKYIKKKVLKRTKALNEWLRKKSIPKAISIDTGQSLRVLCQLIGQFRFGSTASSNNESEK